MRAFLSPIAIAALGAAFVADTVIAQSVDMADHVVMIEWPTLKGRTYALEVSSDLQSWTPLLAEVTGISKQIGHLVWVTDAPHYFRARKAPKSIFEPPARELEETGAIDWHHALTSHRFTLTEAFDGTDLSQWAVPPADAASWIVAEGRLNVVSGPDRRASTLWTKAVYTDFVMAFDFRFGEGTVDSGIFIRGTDQIQIGESRSLQRDMTASPYIPGIGYPVEAEGVATLLRPDDWNAMRIEAIGPHYVTWLNGQQVASYTSTTAKERGAIGIQLHGDLDMAIDFRDIRIASLER